MYLAEKIPQNRNTIYLCTVVYKQHNSLHIAYTKVLRWKYIYIIYCIEGRGGVAYIIDINHIIMQFLLASI